MLYKELAELYKRLEKTTLKTLKTKFVADFLKKVEDEELLEIVPYLILGKVFPDWDERELGVGEKLLIRAVAMATGINAEWIENSVKDTGDLGESVALALQKRKQKSFFGQPLTIKRVYKTLVKVAETTGEGSQDRKLKYLANLFMDAEPIEGKYLARTILGTMRTGVGEGILRDAIAEAFKVKPELVERAYMLTSDFGFVAKVAKLEGDEGLSKVTIQIGKPIKPMLAQMAASVREALIEMGGEAEFEVKYDGARVQVHKDRDKVMRAFKKQRLQVLVATDLAARGIDVENLAYVIHYQIPDSLDYYTHRSGRTARAGKKGISLSFVSSQELKQIKYFENKLNISFTQVR